MVIINFGEYLARLLGRLWGATPQNHFQCHFWTFATNKKTTFLNFQTKVFFTAP